MKNLVRVFILGFVLCYSISSQAQYQSIFGQNSTEWVFEWSNLGGAAQSTATQEGDTTLNGYIYKKIILQSYSPGSHDIGLLREDTTMGRVWFRALQGEYPNYSDTMERLIFDFSLNQGDTFFIQQVPSLGVDTFTIVDSVYFDNQGRKCLRFNNYPPNMMIALKEPFTMIEGIGGNNGVLFLHQAFIAFHHQYLLCYKRDGVETYLNSFYNNCLVHDGTVVTELPNTTIQVYPNPVQSTIYIEKEGAISIQNIQLYNSLGQKILEMPFQNSLDMSYLPNGIYHLVLVYRQYSIFQQSIIKLHTTGQK